MTTERKEGFYWVRGHYGKAWDAAEWTRRGWLLAGLSAALSDDDLGEIGDRIPAPGEGWQCVPVEITPAMRRSGQHAQDHQCYIDGIYADIIAAAPKP